MKLRRNITESPNDKTIFDVFFINALSRLQFDHKDWFYDYFSELELNWYPIIDGDSYLINKVVVETALQTTPYLQTEEARNKYPHSFYLRNSPLPGGYVSLELTIEDALTTENDDFKSFKGKDGAVIKAELFLNLEYIKYVEDKNKHKELAQKALNGLHAFDKLDIYKYYKSEGECVEFSKICFFEAHEGNEQLKQNLYNLLFTIRNDILGESLRPLIEYIVFLYETI